VTESQKFTTALVSAGNGNMYQHNGNGIIYLTSQQCFILGKVGIVEFNVPLDTV